MRSAARVAAAIAATVVVFGSSSVATAGQTGVADVYETSAVAGGMHVELAVPAFFEVFGPYAFAEASNGSSHSYEAPGYGGFFLTAAAEQFGFPPPPGTTETLYPQGPRSAGTPPSPADANVIESFGRSTPTGASGRAVVARGAAAPVFDVGLGRAAASVIADLAGGVRSRSTIVMEDIELADGLVSIDQVTGTATSRSNGRPGGGHADGSIAMTGIRVADVPIDLRADGVVVNGEPYTMPEGALPVEDVLAQAGVTIERLPDVKKVSSDGTNSEMRIGGVRFTFAPPGAEFRFAVTFGDLVARTRALDLPAVAPVILPSLGSTSQPIVQASVSAAPRTIAPSAVEPPAVLLTRRVIRTAPARGADWIAIAALAAMAAPLSLIFRRALRAASRP
jgi:hypothetical protein